MLCGHLKAHLKSGQLKAPLISAVASGQPKAQLKNYSREREKADHDERQTST